MVIRLGYVSIAKALPVTSSSPYTLTSFRERKDYDKLSRIIISNLEALLEIQKYNVKNNIHFYRMTSNLIPLATHPDLSFDYLSPYLSYYRQIGQLIRENKMRVDMHPNEYCVLNSTKEEVVKASIEILNYHYHLLEAMEIEPKIIILHVGSSTFGKKNSLSRFIHQFQKLPKYLQEIIAIENDDKVFQIEDCLFLSKQLNIPVVLDYHHFKCNNTGTDLRNYLEDIWKSWKGIRPKIHFSSPKNKREFRAHHEYIDSESFIEFLRIIRDYSQDVDIMLEAKAKDDALFRLVRELKYKENYLFLDDTSFKI